MVLSASLIKRLNENNYYAKEGSRLWGGKGAERLQLKGEVEREDFVALVRNRVPGSKGQDRLTARNNTTREEWKLDPVTGQWGWKDVANRQTGYDWTFSVPKSVSLYLARTKTPWWRNSPTKPLRQPWIRRRPACSARFGVKGPTVTRATMTG